MPRKIEISHKTIIFTVLFLASVWFVIYIKDIVIQLFVALLLMTVLNPFVVSLSKYKIPKPISILFSYILFFGFFGIAVASVVPALIEQTTNLVNGIPKYLQNSGLREYINDDMVREIVSQLGAIPSQIIKAGLSLLNNIFSVLSVAIFAFYLLLQRDKFDQNLEKLVGKDRSKSVSLFVNKLEVNLGGWARGQFILMLLVGVLSYLGFLLLGIPYALPLAMLAGILEIVPYVGPIIAAVPVVILAFSISPFLGLAAIGLTVLIQQLENYVIVPKVMEKNAGVSPVVTLLALAVGFELAGIVGMIISVPLVVILQTFISHKYGRD